MAVPNIFATATTSIPLSQLDTNFATAITLGSTALYLGNTTTSVAGLTLTGGAFNGTVGATTPSTGAFTTLSATGNISTSAGGDVGIGMTPVNVLDITKTQNAASRANLLNSNASGAASAAYRATNGNANMEILMLGTGFTTAGVNTANTGVVSASFDLALSYGGGGAASLKFAYGSTEMMRLDSSGNLGLGVTPNAWLSLKGLQIVGGGSLLSNTNSTFIGSNWYYDGANKYIANGFSSRYILENGSHQWYTAPNNTSGAGAALTFTTAMTLDSTGLSVTKDLYVNDAASSPTGGIYLGQSGFRASILWNVTTGNLDITPRSGFTTNITAGGLAVTGTLSTTINAGGNTAVAETILNTGGNTAVKILGTAGSTAGAMLNARSDGSLRIYQGTTTGADGTEAAVFDSTGLAVTGTLSATGTVTANELSITNLQITNSGNNVQMINQNLGGFVHFADENGFTWNTFSGGWLTRMTIGDNGIVSMPVYGAGAATFSAAGVISSVSDETWKVKDGAPVDTDAMLNKLEPGYWYYNDEKKETFGKDRQLGFYAQNVNAAIGPEAAPEPETVVTKNDDGTETSVTKPWGYYDRSVLAVTVMSLQKALATIESLTARITALEAK